MNAGRVVDFLERYWIETTDASTVVLIRTFYGLVTFAWAATLVPDHGSIFGEEGLASTIPIGDGQILSLFRWISIDGLALPTILALMVSSVIVVAGVRVRVTVPITALLVASLVDASTPWAIGAERVLVLVGVLLTLFSALTPTRLQGHHTDQTGSRGRAPQWGIRVLQLQFAIAYASTSAEKALGNDWTDGSAVFHALASDTLQRFTVPAFILNNGALLASITWLTLAIEAALPVLLLWPRTRRWAVLLAIGLHVGIEVFLQLGFFAPAMTIGILSFVSNADAKRVLDLAESLLRRLARPFASVRLDGKGLQTDM